MRRAAEVLAAAVLGAAVAGPRPPQDFAAYYVSAAAVVDGRPELVYAPENLAARGDYADRFVAVTGLARPQVLSHQGSPASLVPFLGLARLPWAVASVVWRAALALAYFVALRRCRLSLPGVAGLAFGAFAVWAGNLSALLLPMAVADDAIAGVLLGWLVLAKLWPVVLVGAAYRRPRLVAWAALTAVVLIGASLVSGPAWSDWLPYLAAFERLGVERGLPWDVSPTAELGMAIWPAWAGALAALWWVRGRRWNEAVVLAVLAAPIVWLHYLSVLPALRTPETRKAAPPERGEGRN